MPKPLRIRASMKLRIGRPRAGRSEVHAQQKASAKRRRLERRKIDPPAPKMYPKSTDRHVPADCGIGLRVGARRERHPTRFVIHCVRGSGLTDVSGGYWAEIEARLERPRSERGRSAR